MKYHEYSQLGKEQDFLKAQSVARSIHDFMCRSEIQKKISNEHQINATSGQIQEIILPHCQSLGMSSEQKGLFISYPTPQLRPDYYLKINKTGLIMEVERGKTINNNMDLLNIWKCHICDVAHYLLLVVPVIRQTNKGNKQIIFEYVVKRIGTFFNEENYINVKGCFIIGYE